MTHPFHWLPVEAWGRIICCLAVLMFNLLYEFLNIARIKILERQLTNSNNDDSMDTISENGDKSYDEKAKLIKDKNHKSLYLLLNGDHIALTIIHTIQTGLRYLLLSSFTTFRVELCFTVVLGAGFAYFLVGWRYSSAK